MVKSLILFSAIASALSVPAQAIAASTIDAVRISPRTAIINQPTVVTATASIVDPGVITNGVTLLQVAATGATTTLGVMHDDGLNGDRSAGDGIYSLNVTFTRAAIGAIQLSVSAAFRGVLLRTRSDNVAMFFQDAAAAQRSIAALSAALASGDRSTALAYVLPTANSARALSQFSQGHFNVLVGILNRATLLSSQPDQRTFVSPVTAPNGASTTVTFTMVPGLDGQWLMNSW